MSYEHFPKNLTAHSKKNHFLLNFLPFFVIYKYNSKPFKNGK